jgi:hypothetical protein
VGLVGLEIADSHDVAPGSDFPGFSKTEVGASLCAQVGAVNWSTLASVGEGQVATDPAGLNSFGLDKPDSENHISV